MNPVSDSTSPTKPLRILTLDGGSSAVATLFVLKELLDRVAEQNGLPPGSLRTCDIFDTIVGIGSGGWLAILLGRFRADITFCLSDWFNLEGRLHPTWKSWQLGYDGIQHSYLETKNLVERIDGLTKRYRSGDCLFETNSNDARTRHVLVAAEKSNGKGYSVFRTYAIPTSAKLPRKLLEGPENPDTFKICSAFGVTGTIKDFASPWKERMESSGKTKFSDIRFPKPHNITEIALEEMWGIYGEEVPISAIVNIGLGQTDLVDVGQQTKPVTSKTLSATTEDIPPSLRSTTPQCDHLVKDQLGEFLTTSRGDTPGPKVASGPQRADTRPKSFGSSKGRKIIVKLKRLEAEMEDNIKIKLREVYPQSPDLYYRFTPGKALLETIDNVISDVVVYRKATERYLGRPDVKHQMDELSKQLLESSAA